MLRLAHHVSRRPQTSHRALSRHTCRRNISTVKTELLEELTSRGLVADVTRLEELKTHISGTRRCIYAGIDPTAKSMHVGHILPMIVLMHFHAHGHSVIPLIGGATAQVGDPSGRKDERKRADSQKVIADAVDLDANVISFFERASVYAQKRIKGSTSPTWNYKNIMNNNSWLKNLNLLNFLTTAGVNVRLNTMLARESVRSRLESHKGITFTEFTYQLLQAYDFFHLHHHNECTIQVGGSDQWGNILAGLEMINREHLDAQLPGTEVVREKGFGITTPLLTTATGEKFGKSAGNAIWLDETMTPVLDFYQFFLNTADADVKKYLSMLTLVPMTEIEDVMKTHETTPERRTGQRLLADEMTEMVHGPDGVQRAHTMSKLLFPSDIDIRDLKTDDVTKAFRGDPRLVFVDPDNLFPVPIVNLAAEQPSFVPSRSEARRLVKSGALSINNKPLTDINYKPTPDDLIDGKMIILRAGRHRHLILTVAAA